MSLTPKQQRLLQFIQDYQTKQGYLPSQQEMARRFRLKSLGSIQNYLKALETKGYVRRVWNGKRALELVKVPSRESTYKIPLAGMVAAGQPVEAIEDLQEVEVPASLLGGGENFALRVRGESMIEEGIYDGDVVILRKQATARNGQTVVALVDGEATLKKFLGKENRVELHPANTTMQPIIVKRHQAFQILGVVVGLIRKY